MRRYVAELSATRAEAAAVAVAGAAHAPRVARHWPIAAAVAGGAHSAGAAARKAAAAGRRRWRAAPRDVHLARSSSPLAAPIAASHSAEPLAVWDGASGGVRQKVRAAASITQQQLILCDEPRQSPQIVSSKCATRRRPTPSSAARSPPAPTERAADGGARGRALLACARARIPLAGRGARGSGRSRGRHSRTGCGCRRPTSRRPRPTSRQQRRWWRTPTERRRSRGVLHCSGRLFRRA